MCSKSNRLIKKCSEKTFLRQSHGNDKKCHLQHNGVGGILFCAIATSEEKTTVANCWFAYCLLFLLSGEWATTDIVHRQ